MMYLYVIPVKLVLDLIGERESRRRSCESRKPVLKEHGFPASSAGQALLSQE